MADLINPQVGSPFTKYFLPGLVLGIIIGAFAGVMLTPILGSTPLPKTSGVPSAASVRHDDHPREELTAPSDTTPADGSPQTEGAPKSQAPKTDSPAPKNPEPQPKK